ncbi:MAG TPA: hypothetical protein VIL48_01150 [Acidimicrobiales bacterium]
MRRTITGRPGSKRMTLGDLRQFLASIESIPDEAEVKARVTWGKHLRSLTVEEEDVGFRDYLKAVEPSEEAEAAASADPASPSEGRGRSSRRPARTS